VLFGAINFEEYTRQSFIRRRHVRYLVVNAMHRGGKVARKLVSGLF
jgi:hypothetical protein